jgi:kanamycin kinase
MEFQRSTPTPAAEALARALADSLAEAERRGDDPREIASLLGRLGDALRVVRKAEEALLLLERGIALARAQGDAKLALANELRRAIALVYAGARGPAGEAFAALFARPEELRAAGLLDFALQHDGKRLAEEGRVPEARARLEEALRLRRERGDPGLIRSSEEALAALPAARPGAPPLAEGPAFE